MVGASFTIIPRRPIRLSSRAQVEGSRGSYFKDCAAGSFDFAQDDTRVPLQPFNVLTLQPRNLFNNFSWIPSNPPLLNTVTISFFFSIGVIRLTIASAFCS